MAVLGAALFVAVRIAGGALFPRKPRIEVPAHRLEKSYQEYLQRRGQAPSADEMQALRDNLINEEVLFQYALALGMQENTAAQARLAQIAQFVEANPHAEGSEKELAESALRLGLHEGDLIVRRIMIDSARRLIRSVVLLKPPDAAQIEQFYAANPGEFMEPARVHLSQIAINAFVWPDTRARAQALAARIEGERLDLPHALALGDESILPAELGPITPQGLEAQAGPDFAAAVMQLPIGHWSAPIASRHGHHLVYVHAREPAHVRPLQEVRAQADALLREKLADEWLALRLRELRLEYEIVVAGESP